MKNTVKAIYFIGIIVSLLIGCSEGIPSETEAPSPTSTLRITSTTRVNNSTSTPGQITEDISTPTVTMDSAYQTWHATALAMQSTEEAASNLALDNKATEIAKFPVSCNEMNFYSSGISPDGKWLSASCGYKRDQTLIVQNKKGTKWVLEFKNFLNSVFDGNPPMGALSTKFWSPDGEYLYFTSYIGYDGGGNQCFPGFGVSGLFRLNLTTGSWATLIPPTDSPTGYKIKFAPTGRRYATEMNGITITDLNTGKVAKIAASGVMDLDWSPDGTRLAYSVASCGEQFVQSSSVYVWDTLTDQAKILFTTDGILLRPEAWSDNSTLRISGEKIVDNDVLYTTYIYDISQENLVFTGTATPTP